MQHVIPAEVVRLDWNSSSRSLKVLGGAPDNVLSIPGFEYAVDFARDVVNGFLYTIEYETDTLSLYSWLNGTASPVLMERRANNEHRFRFLHAFENEENRSVQLSHICGLSVLEDKNATAVLPAVGCLQEEGVVDNAALNYLASNDSALLNITVGWWDMRSSAFSSPMMVWNNFSSGKVLLCARRGAW